MTLADINRLIAKVLRRIQLTHDNLVKLCLTQCLRWLTLAKKELIRGDMEYARDSVSKAMERIQDARRYSKA